MNKFSNAFVTQSSSQNALASALTSLSSVATALSNLSNAGSSVSSSSTQLIDAGYLLDKIAGAYQAFDYLVEFLSHPTCRLLDGAQLSHLYQHGTFLSVSLGTFNAWSPDSAVPLANEAGSSRKLRDILLTFTVAGAAAGAQHSFSFDCASIGPWRYLKLVKLLTPAFNERIVATTGAGPDMALYGSVYSFHAPGMALTTEGVCPFFLQDW